uniref:Uncharacterized protein n=1 Tax=Streptomyces sp. NBC_00119 TaxID=2975659 RepID=A0AAU1TZE4_9ACTN
MADAVLRWAQPGEWVRSTGHKKPVAQAKQTLRHFSEVYVSDVLHRITGDRATRRVYDDTELKDAFTAQGQCIADAGIDYPGTWIVVEGTTIRLRRAAANAVADDLPVQDIDKLIEELEQIDATITALRATKPP